MSNVDNDFIPIALPYFDEEEVSATAKTIRSGWVTQGPEVAAFETEFARFVGSQYACAVSNCTTAIQLALLAVGVSPGDEVITVSHSFIATANAIVHCGATPVFVDIDLDIYNMNPDLLEAAITPNTKAILCVHQLGMPCDIFSILKIAKKYNIPVIEDAACATGSQIKNENLVERIGKPHGDIACFSFHPRKVITTGDGGMLTTNNAEWDKKFRLWRHHGMSLSDHARHHAKEIHFEEYPIIGYNYRMTDIQAAVGRKQLEKLTSIVEARRQVAQNYQELLKNMDEVLFPKEPGWAVSNWQSYAIRLKNPLKQKSVMQHMLNKGVATRRGVMCIHREPAYHHLATPHSLTHSEIAQDQTILLPIYPQLTAEKIKRVVAVLKQAIN